MSTPVWRMEGPAHAPVLVLLHPIATHSVVWTHQAAIWSARFRVLSIDLPGHGASEPLEGTPSLHDYAMAVGRVLAQADVERASFVGLSLGGMVAQAFALACPKQVQALVLAHTTARTEPPVRDLWSRRLEQMAVAGMESQVAPALERWFTRAFAAASPLTMAWLAQQIRATSPAGYKAAVAAIQSLDHLDRLGEIKAPTLVIAGAADSAVPPALAAAMAERISGTEFAVIEDAAHIGNVQQPTVFTETVGRFVTRAVLS